MMTQSPPTWDLSPWCPGIHHSEYAEAYQNCARRLSELESQGQALPMIHQDTRSEWIHWMLDLEATAVELFHLRAFVGGVSSTDASNEKARSETARIASLLAKYQALEGQLEEALGAIEDTVFLRLLSAPECEGAEYRLRRLRDRASRRLSSETERLIGDLAVNGLHAWGRLYNDITGDMTFRVGEQDMPLAWRRSLLQDPEDNTRRDAFESSNAALARQGTILASTLNAIAGTRITVQKWRGTGSVLDEAVAVEGMERRTLDAMLSAVEARRPIAWAYHDLKAQVLGRDKIRFSDLGAPLSVGAPITFTWDEAQRLVLDAFDAYHPSLREFAEEMFNERRIEAEPRTGKRSGAYCTSSKKDRTSRIFMTFRGALGDVVTLAHELGHAYHNAVMSEMRFWACGYPASLAETASILAETLVGDYLLEDPNTSRGLRLQVLDKRLHSAAVYMLNIPMRYEFEKTFYERRLAGPLSVNELCALMSETQQRVYGDGLDPEGTDPWFWASKLHFFLTNISFYNFPYTFGYLFSSGVLAEAKAQGPHEFQPRLEALLKATAAGSVEEVVKGSLGVDLGQPDFWLRSLEKVETDLKAFREAVTP